MYLEITVGASSSGKSTYAEAEVKKSRGMLVNLNRDSIRIQLFAIKGWGEYKFGKESENLVTAVQRSAIDAAIKSGKNVIVSDTNLKEQYRAEFKKIALDSGYEYRETWFSVGLDELKMRNENRGGWKIGDNMLEQMYNSFVEQHDDTKFTYNSDFMQSTETYFGDTSLPNAVIFDTDGTTATMVNRRPFDWDKVGFDMPKYNVINHALDLKSRGIKIINLSGRDGICKDATRQWYDRVGMPCDAHFQRETGDQRPDEVIKKEMFFRDIATKYNVLYAVDDRNKVVDMWRSIGLECWQVNSGCF